MLHSKGNNQIERKEEKSMKFKVETLPNYRIAYMRRVGPYGPANIEVMEQLKSGGFIFDSGNKSHSMLAELDKGIRERLDKVMKVIQLDLKDLQNAKKNEKQYMNPYANVQVMDGRYYDKKN